jgi:hypothetical protein
MENDPSYEFYIYKDDEDIPQNEEVSYWKSPNTISDVEIKEPVRVVPEPVFNVEPIPTPIVTTPTYKVEPNSFSFKAFLEITGFSSYSGNLKIYIDSDLISEQSIEVGNFSISFNVSNKYNSGNRSVNILIDAGNHYFQQTVILLRK